jgi:quercetin dioxygenase-like cupin family protein
MYVTNLEKVKKIKPEMPGAKDIWKQVPVSKENGTPNFSFRVFTIEPGGHTPLHSHASEHVNYIIEGNGTLQVGSETRNVTKGDFALVLPNETHQYSNTGKSNLVMICAVPKEYE